MAPGDRARRASPRRPAPTAPGGTPSTTRSAPRDRVGRVGLGPVAQAQLQRPRAGRPRRGRRRRSRRSDPARRSTQRQRAVDQPDAQHAPRARTGVMPLRPPGDEARERLDHAPVLVLEPDADAAGSAAGRRRPSGRGMMPLGLELGVGGGRVASGPGAGTRPGRSCRGSGGPCRPDARDLRRVSQGSQCVVVGARALLRAPGPRAPRRPPPGPACDTLNGPRTRLHHVDDRRARRVIQPRRSAASP